jgi:hypothetical protein
MNKIHYVHYKVTSKIILVPRHSAVEVKWIYATEIQVTDNVLLDIITPNFYLKRGLKSIFYLIFNNKEFLT